MSESPPLSGRTALVTGAGSGIGSAIAVELARAGAFVVVQDLRLEAAQVVAEGILAAGGVAEATGGDISHPADVRAIVDPLLQARGQVGILVNKRERRLG